MIKIINNIIFNNEIFLFWIIKYAIKILKKIAATGALAKDTEAK